MNTPAAAPLFAKVPANVSFPALEQGILELWRRLDAFRESNRRRQGGPEFVFYDGPPFATGTPHYGHLLAGTIKDIVPRFWSMRGHHVERRFGWDCHGLPIENLAQKALGWTGAAEIREKGVDVFNEQCRSMVQTYVGEWRRTVERMGRWVDFDNDYKTMDPHFMESVWWVFKQLWEQRDAHGRPRIYKAHRIMPYDPVLSTPLSNFEAGNNYKDVQDPAITIRFRLHEGAVAKLGLDHRAPGALVYALAWTTTPWTLPANLGLCVGPDIAYVAVRETTSGEVHLHRRGPPGRLREETRAVRGAAARHRQGPGRPRLRAAAAVLPRHRARLQHPGRRVRHHRGRHRHRPPRARLRRGRLPRLRGAPASSSSTRSTASAASPRRSPSTPASSARTPTRRSSSG